MIQYRLNPSIDNNQLNALYIAAWGSTQSSDFTPILTRSLGYIGAFVEAEFIGFAYLAWDGGIHAFLLDPTVHPTWQRRGIGKTLVHHLIDLARSRGIEWIHVDYEPHLTAFYQACGFQPTLAGLYRVGS